MPTNTENTESYMAIIAISRRGAALGAAIRDALGGDAALHVVRRFADDMDGAIAFDLPVRPVVARLFGECERLVLMMPVGAAVRLLAAHIGDKHSDCAVVCVDDGGRFAVSLLSGHVGGADALTERIADAIGATAVITSASHALETLAVDLLGADLGWRIEASSTMVTRASAAVVNGEPVGVYQDAGRTRLVGRRQAAAIEHNRLRHDRRAGGVPECAGDKRPRRCVRACRGAGTQDACRV